MNIDSVRWKYPTSTFSAYSDGDIYKFESWVCAEHANTPTQQEMNDWTKEYEDSQEYACANFNTDTAVASINSALPVEARIALGPYYAIMKDYMNYPGQLRNFSDLKAMMLGLISSEIMTQDQYNTIAAVILEQGVDLTKF